MDVVDEVGQGFWLFRRPVKFALGGGVITAAVTFAFVKGIGTLLALLLLLPSFGVGCLLGLAVYAVLRLGVSPLD